MKRKDQLKGFFDLTRLLSRRVGAVAVGGLVVATMMMIPATAARAGPIHTTAPRLVSGLTPLPIAPPVPEPLPAETCGTRPKRQSWEQDNALSVNPTDPDHLVAAWMQDFADAIVVGYSLDGGGSWTKRVPVTTPCTGPDGLKLGTDGGPGKVSAIDPWVAVGPALEPSPHGIVYLSSVVATSDFARSALVVNRSLDGGESWTPPMVLHEAEFPLAGVDGSYVVANPRVPGEAYVVWQEPDFTGSTRPQYISGTADGGATWSSPAQIPSPLPQGAGQLLILPDGTLVDIVNEVPPQAALGAHFLLRDASQGTAASPVKAVGPTTFVARRSHDHGVSWGPPIRIAATEPSTVAGLSAALAPDGTIYVAWQQRELGSSFSVMYSKSTDGGLTWQLPERVGEVAVGPPQDNQLDVLAVPSLAVAGDGALGVGFYDHRNDDPSIDPPLSTDYWFRHSHDGGATWHEDHLAGPFDQWTAPSDDFRVPVGQGPGFLGDSQGIAPLARGFAANFVLAMPFATKNTDIFFSRLRIKQANRVRNGSFEQPNEQATGPAAWTGTSTEGGSASWSSGSVWLTGNGGSVLLLGSPCWTSDPIAVNPGETLALQATVKSVAASSPAGAGLVYLDALGQVVGSVTPISVPVDSGGFTTLESRLVVPAGASQARVVLGAFSPFDTSAAGTVTFDEVGLFDS